MNNWIEAGSNRRLDFIADRLADKSVRIDRRLETLLQRYNTLCPPQVASRTLSMAT